MAEVTIRYVEKVFGHPEPGSVVRVERTDTVDGLLAVGYAVEVDSDPVENQETDGAE